ncbi:V-type proton ATPase subunit C 2 isoform X3 [Sarcophilus harrisii]|uniref:V-type proton ATPase subunit C n=1 Tax=Sarcophilus harrisii TaxID=9305 RepID=A0A7N4UXU0_SARHA|nr:V-type proton ATPase subunit C 2 isoform X3 [Sarcophilus harrisii]
MFGKQHMFTSFINVSCYYSDDTLNEGPGPGRLGWKEERLGESQRASRGPASDDLVPYANPQAGGGSEATSRELLGDKTPGGRGGAGGSSWSLNRLGAGARAHQGLIWAKGVAAALQRPRQPAAGGSPALPSPVPAVPKAIPRRSGGAPTPRLPRRIVRIVPNPSSRPPRVSSLSALRPSDAPWHARLLHFAPVVTLTKRKDLNMSSEFWLISAPGDKENLQALERMNTVTSKSNLSHNTKFAIPDFKVGTLDSLVGLSDELGKLDTFAESLIKKMAQCVVEVMEDTKGKVYENLLANGVDLTSFVTRFEWDMAKYPAKQPLVVVVDTLAKQLAQIETDLKARTAAYNTLKGNLENLEKKSTGNLFTRTLADIVNKEDFVLDSEYLITLLVIVPKPNYSQWQKRYESLSDMVVPRSTKLIAEDDEGGLFTVTMFRKVINDFKAKAKENKFIVREFFYDEKEIKSEREEMTKLLSEKKQQYGPLLRWLKVNFSEAFIAWIHLKALRVFVESVLRYGLPVNFQAVLLQPHKKATKRLREVLNSVFKHLDEVAAASILDASVDIPGLQLNNQDYFPYVYFHIDLSLLD